MKVSTDACLFGAWIADMLFKNELRPSNILDAGAGTGLLSLMLAQKSISTIDAIEIDGNAYSQAQENIRTSVFHDRIQPYLGDLFHFSYKHKYDLIVCNPPFFIDQLKSTDSDKRLAMHNDTKNFKNYFSFAKNNLTSVGYFALLISYKDFDRSLLWAAELGLHPAKIVQVQHSPTHAFSRVFLLFSERRVMPVTEKITIQTSGRDYDERFKYLLADYYL